MSKVVSANATTRTMNYVINDVTVPEFYKKTYRDKKLTKKIRSKKSYIKFLKVGGFVGVSPLAVDMLFSAVNVDLIPNGIAFIPFVIGGMMFASIHQSIRPVNSTQVMVTSGELQKIKDMEELPVNINPYAQWDGLLELYDKN